MAVAYRAGAELRDMEFMQFHPTVLYIAGGSRHLISEAARGEGAWLVDRHGHRFMHDYDARGELAPRDVVSLAIVSQMERTRHPNVYLDLTHLDAGTGAGAISRHCRDLRGVRPGYHPRPHSGPARGPLHDGRRHRGRRGPDHAAGPVGGRRGDGQRTARRQSAGLQQPLGGPGLRGASAGEAASQAAAELRDEFSALRLENPRVEPLGEPLNLADIRNALKSLMWRTWASAAMPKGSPRPRRTSSIGAATCCARQFSDPTGWELQNMLCVARLMIRAALERCESRGAQVRTDFPELDQRQWNRHITFQRETAAG